MCYNVAYLTRRKITYAQRAGASEAEIAELQEQLERITTDRPAMFHCSGFTHPELLCFTRAHGPQFHFFRWGLIPEWVKDAAQAATMSRQTLNARGESLFEKPAFRNAVHHRCLVLVDGYFEFHHFAKGTYPYLIRALDHQPLALGGITSSWQDPSTGQRWATVSIVTTHANPMMQVIHNNPRTEGPRMPFIVPRDLDDVWLAAAVDKDLISSVIQPYPETALEAFTVPPILGKHAVPNTEVAHTNWEYPELLMR